MKWWNGVQWVRLMGKRRVTIQCVLCYTCLPIPSCTMQHHATTRMQPSHHQCVPTVNYYDYDAATGEQDSQTGPRECSTT